MPSTSVECHRRRDTVLLGIAAAALPLIVLLILNPLTYCRAKGQYLSDDKAVMSALRLKSKEIAQFTTSPLPVSDEQLEAYISLHPDCCTVVEFIEKSWVERVLNYLLGNEGKDVQLLYKIDQQNPKARREDPYYEAIVRVRSCGEAHDEAGMSLSQLQYESELQMRRP